MIKSIVDISSLIHFLKIHAISLVLVLQVPMRVVNNN